jgi:hypothetical protein
MDKNWTRQTVHSPVTRQVNFVFHLWQGVQCGHTGHVELLIKNPCPLATTPCNALSTTQQNTLMLHPHDGTAPSLNLESETFQPFVLWVPKNGKLPTHVPVPEKQMNLAQCPDPRTHRSTCRIGSTAILVLVSYGSLTPKDVIS